MGAVFGRGTSLSLSRCSHFLASLWAKFKGLFYSFYHNFILSCRKFFLFHRSFNSSFCLQKAFFRAFCLFEIFKRCVCALLRPFCHFERSEKSKEFKIRFVYGYFACAQYDKFRQKPKFDSLPRFYFVKSCNDGYFYTPKALFRSNFRDKIYNFTRFYGLPRSLCSLAMTANFVILSVATQRVARCKPQQKNPQRLKENLLFLDTSLTLSMTNSGFCLKIMDTFTQILKQKFKFFTQISRHFVNSIHFINFTQNSKHFMNLSQILSLTQGFFIFLPQIFAQCKLINFNTRRKNGR